MNITNTYLERNTLTELLANSLSKMFSIEEIEIVPFGCESIARNSDFLNKYIKLPESNLSHSGMLVKFAPDFIIVRKKQPYDLYFLETKVSVTPLWSNKNTLEIRKNHPNTKLSDIGVIAREAWNAYNNLFPTTIILAACAYNPKILMAQFVKDIKCLRCFKEIFGDGFDCSVCPMKKNDFFPIVRNVNSTGSQTPQTNIDYSSFLEINNFFKNLNITVDKKEIDEVKNIFKTKINFPTTVYDSVKNKIISELIADGCDWL